jgi:hypothetical protein
VAQVGEPAVGEILQTSGSCDDERRASTEALDLSLFRDAADDQRGLSYTSWTCMASSRVGNKTSAVAWADGSLRSISITGIRNARVLPVPVWAVPITSLPSRAGWIARSWIGVKVMN